MSAASLRSDPTRSTFRRTVGPRDWPTFQVWGAAGLCLAVALATALVAVRHQSLLVLWVAVTAAVATFLALAMATKVLCGEERLVYYHHEVAVLATMAAAVAAVGRPVWPYLDATMLGVGVFLAFGRIGCLTSGCCHGRPATPGIRYGEDASACVATGFFGVPLFPVQALEAALVLAIVAVGARLVVRGAQPGMGVAWYLLAYAAVRFALEFARGDADRPHRFGFSQPQWFSVAIAAVFPWVERGTGGPHLAGDLALAPALAGAMVATVLLRRRHPTVTRLRRPGAVLALASAFRTGLDSPGPRAAFVGGALPIWLSCGEGGGRQWFTVSGPPELLDANALAWLARLAAVVVGGRTRRSVEVIALRPGMSHLMIAKISACSAT